MSYVSTCDGSDREQDFVTSIRAAVDGLGLTFSFEEYLVPQIASGALVRVLEDWCPPFAGYFLYCPSRRQQPAALSALIERFAWRIAISDPRGLKVLHNSIDDQTEIRL